MKDLADVPGGRGEWHWDNPGTAVDGFVAHHPEFVREQPPWPTRRNELSENITYWPGGWLRKDCLPR